MFWTNQKNLFKGAGICSVDAQWSTAVCILVFSSSGKLWNPDHPCSTQTVICTNEKLSQNILILLFPCVSPLDISRLKSNLYSSEITSGRTEKGGTTRLVSSNAWSDCDCQMGFFWRNKKTNCVTHVRGESFTVGCSLVSWIPELPMCRPMCSFHCVWALNCSIFLWLCCPDQNNTAFCFQRMWFDFEWKAVELKEVETPWVETSWRTTDSLTGVPRISDWIGSEDWATYQWSVQT